jgi:hypothetical protein
MKKSILFVDDDEREIRGFEKVMATRYIVGADVTLDKALAKLRDNSRVRKPDLILLDLYYGPRTDDDMRSRIAAADRQLSAMETEFRKLLLKAGQSAQGGFDLAQEVHTLLPSSARAFFSRKAFLTDALRAHENGLPLLEKPDSEAEDDSNEAAMRRHADELARKFDRIIGGNTFWAKHREAINGALLGFLVSLGWDLLKGSFFKNWLATVAFLAGAIALALAAWVAKRI